MKIQKWVIFVNENLKININRKKWLSFYHKIVTCLRENTEKYITFTVPIEIEVTRIDKNEKKLRIIYLKSSIYW